MTRKTSAAGRAAIMAREGLRLEAYRDTVGVLTIGTGHTGRASPPAVTDGMTITRAEADTLLASDLMPMEHAVNDIVTVPIGQNQFDAMVSLCFNVGAHGFTGSTVIHRLNAGDTQGAADAFLMWEKPPDLRRRREAERAQFLRADADERTGDPAASPAIARPVAGPHLLPQARVGSPPGFWGRIAALLVRKAA